MSNVIALFQERTQLFADLWQGKVPKRVPVLGMFQIEFAIQYAGKDLFEAQWNTGMMEEIYDLTCRDFYSDTMPVAAFRFPSYYKQLGARNYVMSSSGFLQHPEVMGMALEDYDDFIASPYDCIVEKVLPRLYSELDAESGKKAIVLAKAFKTFYDEMGNAGMVVGKISQKYGYALANLFASTCEAPFDFLADLLRGFKNIVTDIRRIPEKVEAAVEVITPMMVKWGKHPVPFEIGATFIPLHMAPFLREKDFARFYWPTFKKTVDDLAEAGYPSFIIAEHDWMRFLDYLYDLPAKTIINFEYGDPKLVKEKLGQKHIISGFYPISLLKTGTKQQCIDKAKELIDILAPGGNYIFSFDKAVITVDSVNVDNLRAVMEYVGTNANY